MGQSCHIITLHNSYNCGAYLQAAALGHILTSRYGLDVSYVDSGARSLRGECIRGCFSALKHLSIPAAKFEIHKFQAFNECLEDLNVVDAFDCAKDALYIFGSDEIWNIERLDIAGYPMLWGEGIPFGFRASYAPSANGSTAASFAANEIFMRNVAAYRFLSARDQATADAVGEALGREVRVVCDPTLLLDARFYTNAEEPTDLDGYLLIYAYGVRMNETEVSAICDFAKNEGLRVVSAGNYLSWADANIPCNGRGFLGLVHNSSFVVTDTFHGSVFASIYHKEFAAFGGHSPKVQDFLDLYGLAPRGVDARNLGLVLTQKVDWDAYEAAIERAKNGAFAYLDAVVTGYRSE